MNTAYCAWCNLKATGTAVYNDGQRYPSCAEHEHGQPGTYKADTGYADTLLERIDTLVDALAAAYKDVDAWRERATAAEERLAGLRYIRRVKGMLPSQAALKMLDEQEAELMKGNTD